MSRPTIKQIECIFGKRANAELYIKQFHPEVFQKKTIRSKKLTYMGEGNPFEFIQNNWKGKQVRRWVFRFCCELEGGKYYEIHSDYKSQKDMLLWYESQRVTLQNKYGFSDICLPDAFSDQIVKPTMRQWIKSKATEEKIKADLELNSQKMIFHHYDRAIAQLKNDLAEYKLLATCKNYIPTLKHNAGDDGYLLDPRTDTIINLDIKTSRWPQGKQKIFGAGATREEAAAALYRHQGKDRYSENPRLYLVLPSSNGEMPTNSLSFEQQLEKSFDVTFIHANKKVREQYGTPENNYERVVEGVRLIFMDNIFLDVNDSIGEYNIQEPTQEKK